MSSIAHYTVPIPETATICPDWESLCEETRLHWGHTALLAKYGGYVIEDKGGIVLVCTASLCAIIEEKDREAQKITFHHPSSGVSLAHYTVQIPGTASVCSDWPSLRAAVLQRPGCPLTRKYGGWVIEEDGIVVIACDEQLSAEFDQDPEMQLGFLAEDMAEQEQERARGGREG